MNASVESLTLSLSKGEAFGPPNLPPPLNMLRPDLLETSFATGPGFVKAAPPARRGAVALQAALTKPAR
jgi:hypothetical protein